MSTTSLTKISTNAEGVKLSKASLKHRIRHFLLGVIALAAGLVGLFIIFRNELSLRPGIAEIPPFFPLYFPGSFLLILAGVAVMARDLMPMQYEIRFCLICESITKQFRADPRFRDGKKIGDSYVCEKCRQKYLHTS